jgi:hypothetical protein
MELASYIRMKECRMGLLDDKKAKKTIQKCFYILGVEVVKKI